MSQTFRYVFIHFFFICTVTPWCVKSSYTTCIEIVGDSIRTSKHYYLVTQVQFFWQSNGPRNQRKLDKSLEKWYSGPIISLEKPFSRPISSGDLLPVILHNIWSSIFHPVYFNLFKKWHSLTKNIRYIKFYFSSGIS